mgnify:CR=1 FL=1
MLEKFRNWMRPLMDPDAISSANKLDRGNVNITQNNIMMFTL